VSQKANNLHSQTNEKTIFIWHTIILQLKEYEAGKNTKEPGGYPRGRMRLPA